MDNQEKAKKFFLEGINLFIKKEFDKEIIGITTKKRIHNSEFVKNIL